MPINHNLASIDIKFLDQAYYNSLPQPQQMEIIEVMAGMEDKYYLEGYECPDKKRLDLSVIMDASREGKTLEFVFSESVNIDALSEEELLERRFNKEAQKIKSFKIELPTTCGLSAWKHYLEHRGEPLGHLGTAKAIEAHWAVQADLHNELARKLNNKLSLEGLASNGRSNEEMPEIERKLINVFIFYQDFLIEKRRALRLDASPENKPT